MKLTQTLPALHVNHQPSLVAEVQGSTVRVRIYGDPVTSGAPSDYLEITLTSAEARRLGRKLYHLADDAEEVES